MSRTLKLCLMAMLVLSLGAAQADFSGTARHLGMGYTGIASADDAAAVDWNPASLGSLNLGPLGPEYDVRPPVPGPHTWQYEVSGTAELSGDADLWGLRVAAYQVNHVHKKHGYAVAHQQFRYPTEWGRAKAEQWNVGYGHVYKYENWNWGLSLTQATIRDGARGDFLLPAQGPVSKQDQLTMQFGLLWRLEQPSGKPIRLGAMVADLWNDTGKGPFYYLGVAAPLGEQVLLSVDWLDLTNRSAAMLNAGLEFEAGQGLFLRAGCADLTGSDSILTLGAGYKGEGWKADVAWLNHPAGRSDQVVFSLAYDF